MLLARTIGKLPENNRGLKDCLPRFAPRKVPREALSKSGKDWPVCQGLCFTLKDASSLVSAWDYLRCYYMLHSPHHPSLVMLWIFCTLPGPAGLFLTWQNLESAGGRKNCLAQTGLWSCLWGTILTDDGYEKAQPTVGGTIPTKVVWCCLRELAKRGSVSARAQAGIPHSSIRYWPGSVNWSNSLPFWPECFVTATESKERQLTEKQGELL